MKRNFFKRANNSLRFVGITETPGVLLIDGFLLLLLFIIIIIIIISLCVPQSLALASEIRHQSFMLKHIEIGYCTFRTWK